jgi:hypothetical protein
MNHDPRQHVPAFVRKRKALESGEYDITFRMRGKFPFPVEMLAEDRCFPASREDAQELLRSVKSHPPDEVVGVTLVHQGSDAWTPGHRWHASGWTVENLPDEPKPASAEPQTAPKSDKPVK